MRSAFALRINSGRIIFVFGIAERLRAFRYPIFTRGDVTVSGSCRVGFLRKHPRGGVPSPSSLRDATSPERGRWHSTYRQMAKSSSFRGELAANAVSRLRGFVSSSTAKCAVSPEALPLEELASSSAR